MKTVIPTVRCKVFLLALGTCVIVGCGSETDPTFPVSGKVVFPDETTLKYGGEVIFLSTGGSKRMRAAGTFGPDGQFELSTFTQGDGAVAGSYEVAVIPIVPDELEGQVSEREYQKLAEQIDRRFHNPSASKLRYTIAAETSPHDFRIEVTEPKRRSRRGRR